MIFMLDTNTCIFLIKQHPPRVLARLTQQVLTDVTLSTITVAELYYGVHKSSQPLRNQQALAQFLLPLTILPFDDEASSHYGQIRAQLEALGQPIGALDALIAAHARSLNLILVTNNTREFQRVPGLRWEDWTLP